MDSFILKRHNSLQMIKKPQFFSQAELKLFLTSISWPTYKLTNRDPNLDLQKGKKFWNKIRI